jgi:hypothetical protein
MESRPPWQDTFEPQLSNIPSQRPLTKTVTDEPVTSKASPDGKSCAVNVDCQPTAGNGKIRYGNWRCSIGRRHGNLAFGIKSGLKALSFCRCGRNLVDYREVPASFFN